MGDETRKPEQTPPQTSEDTAAILSRRRLLIQSIVVGVGVGAAIVVSGQPQPCLSVAPRPCLKPQPPTTKPPTTDPYPEPCLSPPPPPRAEKCLEVMPSTNRVPETQPQVCLRLRRPEPEPGPCLDVAPG